MFSLMSWAIGYSLKQGAEWVKGNVLFGKDLAGALSKTTEKWNEELPKKYRISDLEILFRPLDSENLHNMPHLMALHNQLNDEQIPEPEIWAAAAREQIHYAHQKLCEDAEPICQADDEEITPHLNELGRRLNLTIMQDLETMLPLIYLQLQRMESKLDQLSTRSGNHDTN